MLLLLLLRENDVGDYKNIHLYVVNAEQQRIVEEVYANIWNKSFFCFSFLGRVAKRRVERRCYSFLFCLIRC